MSVLEMTTSKLSLSGLRWWSMRIFGHVIPQRIPQRSPARLNALKSIQIRRSVLASLLSTALLSLSYVSRSVNPVSRKESDWGTASGRTTAASWQVYESHWANAVVEPIASPSGCVCETRVTTVSSFIILKICPVCLKLNIVFSISLANLIKLLLLINHFHNFVGKFD